MTGAKPEDRRSGEKNADHAEPETKARPAPDDPGTSKWGMVSRRRRPERPKD